MRFTDTGLAVLGVEALLATVVAGYVWTHQESVVGRGPFVSRGAVLFILALLLIAAVAGWVSLIGLLITQH